MIKLKIAIIIIALTVQFALSAYGVYLEYRSNIDEAYFKGLIDGFSSTIELKGREK